MEIYDKIKILGEGKFGCVGLYKKFKTNRLYAIKEISIENKPELDILKMQNECGAIKKINSLYVVENYDYFVEDSKMYVVIQHCSHGTLRDLIKDKRKRNVLMMKN